MTNFLGFKPMHRTNYTLVTTEPYGPLSSSKTCELSWVIEEMAKPQVPQKYPGMQKVADKFLCVRYRAGTTMLWPKFLYIAR